MVEYSSRYLVLCWSYGLLPFPTNGLCSAGDDDVDVDVSAVFDESAPANDDVSAGLCTAGLCTAGVCSAPANDDGTAAASKNGDATANDGNAADDGQKSSPSHCRQAYPR